MGLLTTTLRRTTFLFVVCVICVSAQEDEAYNPFILSRVRRSPQWQYAKSDTGTRDSNSDSGSNGGNVRFLSALFGSGNSYERPYYNRPNYGGYGGYGGGGGGSGSHFGLSFNYGQNQHYHNRPGYGGGYDPHYDHHGGMAPSTSLLAQNSITAPFSHNSVAHNPQGVLVWIPVAHLDHHVQLEQQLEEEERQHLVKQQLEEEQKHQQLLEQQHLQQQIEHERLQLEHLVTMQHHLELQQHLNQLHSQVPLDNPDAMVVPGTGIHGGVVGDTGRILSGLPPHDDILVGGGVGLSPPATTIIHRQEIIPGGTPELIQSQITPIIPHIPQIHHELISPIEMLLRQHQLFSTDLNGELIVPQHQMPLPPETLNQPTHPADVMGLEQMIQQVEPLSHLPHPVVRQVEPEPLPIIQSEPETIATSLRPPTILHEVTQTAFNPSTSTTTTLSPTSSSTELFSSSSTTPEEIATTPEEITTTPSASVLKEANNDVEQIENVKNKL